MKKSMIDLQSTVATHSMPLDKVGVKSVKHPVTIIQHGVAPQQVVATFDMYVGLDGDTRGTHMSRFLEILNSANWTISSSSIAEMLQCMTDKLDAVTGEINISFDYFINKKAPVSGVAGLMDYAVKIKAIKNKSVLKIFTNITIPVTTLCPCSKAISEYGAHNQRSHITIELESTAEVDYAKYIKIVETEASCELYTILKREDEKYVTEHAYDNPRFVEDIVRAIADNLKNDSQIQSFAVESENFESIHNHSAYAMTTG